MGKKLLWVVAEGFYAGGISGIDKSIFVLGKLKIV